MKIEKRCSENFNTMAKTVGGKHCNVCETTVIDFTNYSISEIEIYFKNHHEEKICGRYKNFQVNTPTKFEFILLNLKDYIENKISIKPLKIAFLSIISGVLTFTTSCMGKRMPPANERNKDFSNSYYADSLSKKGKPDSLKK